MLSNIIKWIVNIHTFVNSQLQNYKQKQIFLYFYFYLPEAIKNCLIIKHFYFVITTKTEQTERLPLDGAIELNVISLVLVGKAEDIVTHAPFTNWTLQWTLVSMSFNYVFTV